jgi:hypothetical protein
MDITMSSFRHWVHNLWIDNCEERLIYSAGNRLSEKEYFHQFKWWLRREFRHRQKIEKEKNERQHRLY